MNKKTITPIIILFFLTGCTSGLTEYPVFKDYSELQPSVVVAVPKRVWELKPMKLPEDCLSGEYICSAGMDAPPLGFKYEIIEQVYGPSLPKTVEVATTNHLGIALYPRKKLTTRYQSLILISSKNDSHILPRHHSLLVIKLKDGSYVLPIYDEKDLWWLPCSITEEMKPVQFYGLEESLGLPLEEVSDYEENEKYLKKGKGNNLIPVYGIFIKDLKAHLEKNAPKMEDFECNRN